MDSHDSGIGKTIREDRGEFMLLGFIAIVAVVVLLESRELLPQSRRVPVLITLLMIAVLILDVVAKLYGDEIRDKLNWSQTETGFYAEADISSSDQEAEHLYDLNPKPVAKHFGWLVLYLISLAYVGFWTTNVVFPFVYIMIYETSPLPRRLVYYLLWTGLIVSTLWILFVELLQVQAIWRLGFLP